MINKVVRLVGIKQFDVFYEEMQIPSDKLIIRPEYLSICAADLRYYTGQRNKKVLMKKLPLSLIHEATGTVIVDPLGKVGVGRKVVMIPNTNIDDDDIIKGNYQKCSKFRSSDIDGFMQDQIVSEYDRVIPIEDSKDSDIFVLSELISVSVNAISTGLPHIGNSCKKIGIWGDGSLGFVTMIALRSFFPNAEIIVFGHNPRKSLHFIMADRVIDTNEVPDSIMLDGAFECVGGVNSKHAVKQMIELTRPQGFISLLGVSEEPIPINTRKVLEKGLVFLGNSRSEYSDFERAVSIINENDEVRTHLRTIISKKKKVRSLADVYDAFEQAQINDFKTIMKWSI